MRPLTVAIIAVAGFSPFHLSVPFIVFSEKMAEKKHFHVIICAEKPGKRGLCRWVFRNRHP